MANAGTPSAGAHGGQYSPAKGTVEELHQGVGGVEGGSILLPGVVWPPRACRVLVKVVTEMIVII